MNKSNNNQIELLRSIINEHNINPENFNTEHYTLILESIIKEKYPDSELINDKIEKPDTNSIYYYTGSHIYVGNNVKSKIYKNVLCIEFDIFYCQIIRKIMNNYDFNYYNFSYAFEKMYDIYENSLTDENIYKVIKTWLIRTYGYLDSTTLYSDTDNIKSIILNKSKKLFDEVSLDHNKSCIYIETDSMFITYNPKILTALKNSNYKYSIKDIDNIIILNKKKYIIFEDSDNTKIKGLSINY